LPDDWVELLLPPYNLDITQMKDPNAVCLFTGQQILLSGFPQNGEKMTLLDYLRQRMKGGVALIMHFTGNQATLIQFVSLEFNRLVATKRVWLDKMGVSDIGLDQGRLLSLNRAMLSEVIDDFASGKFCDSFRYH
jgi:hypothetical protein